jgi:hypothetical protein
MKNSNDTIGNRTRDLPVCSAVPRCNIAIYIYLLAFCDLFTGYVNGCTNVGLKYSVYFIWKYENVMKKNA